MTEDRTKPNPDYTNAPSGVENTFRDFTWKEFRPDHKPGPPRPIGIPLSTPGSDMTPQKAGALLCKVASKSKMASRGGKPKGHTVKVGVKK